MDISVNSMKFIDFSESAIIFKESAKLLASKPLLQLHLAPCKKFCVFGRRRPNKNLRILFWLFLKRVKTSIHIRVCVFKELSSIEHFYYLISSRRPQPRPWRKGTRSTRQWSAWYDCNSQPASSATVSKNNFWSLNLWNSVEDLIGR